MGRRAVNSEFPLEHRPLADRYRALCRKYRALVDRYGAEMDGAGATLGLSFAAIRRSHTGMALLCGGTFLVRNARWLALERREGDWGCDERSYPNLRALAMGEASAMAHARERTRELRFSPSDCSAVIEVRIEQLDRPGKPVYLGMVRDVTEAVRAEEREQRERSEAAHRERLRAVGDFASEAAHRINNVLHAMALRLASLRGQPEGVERQQSLEALAQLVTEAAGCVSRLQDATGRSHAEERPTPVPGLAPAELPRLHILVVDDDPDVLEAAGLALAHLGQDVDGTPSGADAIGRFTAGERFDLVLCDIGMPGIDGWQVAREVHSISPRTQLYLVSGWAREIRSEEVQRAGASGLLAKPLSLDTLRAVLATVPVTAARQTHAPAHAELH